MSQEEVRSRSDPIPDMMVSNTPKRLIFEDPKIKKSPRPKKNRRKKNGEMVFVNYTVHDDKKSQGYEQVLQSTDKTPQMGFPLEKNLTAIEVDDERKSSKRSMLKIFGSKGSTSTPSPIVPCSISKPPTPVLNNSSLSFASPIESIFGRFPDLKDQQLVNNTSMQIPQAHKVTASVSSDNNHMLPLASDYDKLIYEFANENDETQSIHHYNSSTHLTTGTAINDQEFVPKSNPNPSLARPPWQKSDLHKRPRTNTIPLLNAGAYKFNLNLSIGMNSKTKVQQNNEYRDFEGSNSRPEKNKHQEFTNHSRAHESGSTKMQFIDLDTNLNENLNSPSSNRVSLSSESSTLTRLPEDNDASIAFSKMFNRNRANTGGSMCSIGSSPNTTTGPFVSQIPNSTQTHGTIPNRYVVARTTSMRSFSSMDNNKSSPMRAPSPMRPRSSTRGSSFYKLSRDMNIIGSAPIIAESPQTTEVSSESFIDFHISNKSREYTNRVHKNKQESISDNFKLQCMNTNNGFNGHSTSASISQMPLCGAITTTSSNSATSSPSMPDTNTSTNSTQYIHGGQLSYNSYLTNENSYLEMSQPVNSRIAKVEPLMKPSLEDVSEIVSEIDFNELQHNEDDMVLLRGNIGSGPESFRSDESGLVSNKIMELNAKDKNIHISMDTMNNTSSKEFDTYFNTIFKGKVHRDGTHNSNNLSADPELIIDQEHQGELDEQFQRATFFMERDHGVSIQPSQVNDNKEAIDARDAWLTSKEQRLKKGLTTNSYFCYSTQNDSNDYSQEATRSSTE